jgi:hypothetical protein
MAKEKKKERVAQLDKSKFSVSESYSVGPGGNLRSHNYMTPHSLADVLKPGYFQGLNGVVKENDLLILGTKIGTDAPEVGFVVFGIDKDGQLCLVGANLPKESKSAAEK